MVFHDDAARREVAVQLVVKFIVTEADGSCVGPAVGENDAFDARPVGRGQAHRAGFARGVEGAAGQVKVLDVGAGAADDVDFGMAVGSWVATTRFQLSAIILPSRTMTAPNGPPSPHSLPCRASSMARARNWSSVIWAFLPEGRAIK